MYLREAPSDWKADLGRIEAMIKSVFTLRVELDPSRLRIGQPVEAVNGTFVKVPIPRRE
ncbi:MAG: hypothetical protein QW794_01925 [Thermosphaera sp.]|uniref:Conserved within P. aerophilum part 2, authentic frameshift n=2 Tax=Pyrobaculum aerophilum TaxID=13773 RepID=Q8ZWE7_PYRAE|nr:MULTISPECIES: hypothetical protein [Pyrobaculum]AAL63755.1 conserved within P. aerophilum part 2, authentic frameshift [Pyrobaculum aerophilum str. IM2]MCX8137533.1 hypothetical protein [Pyrobaculum aerophilum]HII46303.1 hypothetical protein [Pyrobaculum aerophilum]